MAFDSVGRVLVLVGAVRIVLTIGLNVILRLPGRN